MLIKHYQNELIDDFEHREAKRTFFLVPTKPLVDQQAKQIQTWTSLRVGQFTGQTEIEEKGKVIGIDFWSKEMWKEKFKKYHVLVMTPQILLRLLTHRQIHLSKINLIVFDEAHWAGPKRNLAKSNHDYTQIVDYIRNQVNEHQPRILGLSASLIKNKVNPERIRQYVKVFEQSFNAKCLTVYGIEDLGDKSTNPREILWCFASDSIIACSLVNNILSKVFEFLDSLIQEYESQNHIQYADTDSNKEELNIRITTKLPLGPSKLKLCLEQIYEILIEMGPWCGENVIKYFSDYFDYILNLYGHIIPPYKEILDSFLQILETCRSILKEFMSEMTEQQKLIDFVSPKMKRLLELLLNFKNNDEKLDKQICGLVFVQRRAECKTLTSWLTELKKYDPDNFGFMEVGYAVGISNQPGFLKSLVSSTQKTQTRTLEEFRSGKKNLLIATSVLEEGLDVGGCNLVVRYDFPHTLRDYLQSKGRARNNDSHYVLFCPEKERY
ncbi:endoribonuclease Dicer-like protein, partial [Dinothrombium tinctorium]